MKLNETRYIKVEPNETEKRSFKIVKKDNSYKITSVILYYDKYNKNLLKHASIKDYIDYINPDNQSTTKLNPNIDIHNPKYFISIKEFEELMKKAFGHFVREIPDADIFVARESKLNKKLMINYTIEDEPEIKVR